MYTSNRLEWHLGVEKRSEPLSALWWVLSSNKQGFCLFSTALLSLMPRAKIHQSTLRGFAFGRSNAVRRWLDLGYPATRARQSRDGGLRIEPVGSDESFAYSASSHLSLSKCDAMTWLRSGHGQNTERTVFTYGKAVLCSNIHQSGL